ncbi:MAG TPA: DUF5916 domain-containing protein [Thermoanaerobaculia bacterium]|nr:DUF5916 domain-containing protein [Thermoanaerobaculia bacterium]
MRPKTHSLLAVLVVLLAGLSPAALRADDGTPRLHIVRAKGAITIDGDLSDPGWQGVPPIDTFWETKKSDNGAPPARTVARLAYDARYLYAAFEFKDPRPDLIRAPLGDRDNIDGDTDYGGIILDTRNDAKTAILFLVNPRNVQYDAVTSDASGEDSSPDFFWDSATRITKDGWVLEMRIPFSTLRYTKAEPLTWGVLLYRNYPRDFHYQMFSARLPRGSNCFICHENKLDGLSGLPPGGHLVAAPYVTGKQEAVPGGDLGTPLRTRPAKADGGLDLKWTPNAFNALDATINPDFSQVESDVAQISTNQRFALFFPEKRPFFLEGSDLFSTPIQAVYTRTITDPGWGARATGKLGDSAYTFLLTEDHGGGSVILPGPIASSLANQDFSSRVAVGRLRRDLGTSFASFLLTDREIVGGGHNRVLGPDFLWRPSGNDSLTGQVLYSDTQTPNRPDLAAEWDGRQLRSHAADLSWSHSTRTFDTYFEVKDIGDGFRADEGFLPQVGIRSSFTELGRSFYPQAGLLSRLRPFVTGTYTTDTGNGLLLSRYGAGSEIEGVRNSYARFSMNNDRVFSGQQIFTRPHFDYHFEVSPSRAIGRITLDGFVGDDVDYANSRLGRGAEIDLTSVLRPTGHLELRLIADRRWLDVSPPGRGSSRLFTAQVGRIKATYTFTARTFVRLIGQETRVDLDPTLYTAVLPAHSEDVTASILFAYKINWQTVLFLGYGDERATAENLTLAPADRQLFLKVSYAYQQ